MVKTLETSVSHTVCKYVCVWSEITQKSKMFNGLTIRSHLDKDSVRDRQVKVMTNKDTSRNPSIHCVIILARGEIQSAAVRTRGSVSFKVNHSLVWKV